MIETLLGTSITGALISEPELIAHAQVLVARFAIEVHTGDDKETYEVYAYGAIARECVKNLGLGQDITIEGRLIKRLCEVNDQRPRVGDAIVANRVWLNHLRLLVA
ncbi:MAG: hypothetical protein ACLPYS_04320 [Vulcanimicrobiaceae bacterium]|jgi:hypothetical protein